VKPKVIKTEADYQAALSSIESRFDAKPGTPEGEELELLAILVELYEKQAFPIGLPDPISAIRFRMDQQGLKDKDLVPYIGSPSKVSEVLSGQRSLSLPMLRRLHTGLGIPSEVLLQESGGKFDPNDPVLQWHHFPLAEMVKRNWFAGFRGTLADAREQAEDLLATFAAGLGLAALKPVFNRQHVRSGSESNPYALAAWRIRIANLAMKETLPPYSPSVITSDFLRSLAQLSYLNDGPRLTKEFLNKNGIHFVMESHLPKTFLDGAAMKLPDGSPLVALTLRYDRLDNFWFTLFHELAHVALHLCAGKYDTFYDDLNEKHTDKCEIEADEFASEALVPEKEWKASGLRRSSNAAAVYAFADRLRISPAIPAGRIRYEKKNYKIFNPLVGNGKVRCLFESGHN
jgi:HTH-type transcriptional regulator/antitoxin HigA